MDNRDPRNSQGPNIINQLGDTISDLREAIGDAIEEILKKKSRVSDTTDCLVQKYRIDAVALLGKAEKRYRGASEDAQIVALMKSRMEYSLREYVFFTLIAQYLEREKTIATLEEELRQTNNAELSRSKKIFHSLLGFILRYDRGRVLEKQIQAHLVRILSELEQIIENDHFQKFSLEEREDYDLKWKKYSKKAVRTYQVKFRGPFSG